MPPVGQTALPPGSQPMLVESVPLPPLPAPSSINTSAGSQLAQAIQNIVAHSASITAVAGSTPSLIRPGTPQGQQSTTPVHTHGTFSSGGPPLNFRAPNQPFDIQRAPASQSGPSGQGPPQSPGGFPSRGGPPNMGPRGESPSRLPNDKAFNSLGDWQAPGSSPMENAINRASGFGTPNDRGSDGLGQAAGLNRGSGIMGPRPGAPGFSTNQENVRGEGMSQKDRSSGRSDLDEVFGGGGDKDERIIRPQMGGPNQGLSALGPRMGGPNQRMGMPSPGGPNQRFGGLSPGLGGPNQRLMGPGQSMGGPSQRMGGGPNQQRPIGLAGLAGPGPRMVGPGMGSPGMGMGPRGPRGPGSMPSQNAMSGRLPGSNNMGLSDNMEELNNMTGAANMANPGNVGSRPGNSQPGPGGPGDMQRNSANVGGPGLRPGMINNAAVMMMNPRGMSPGGMQGGPRGPSSLIQRLSGPSPPGGGPGVTVSSLLRLSGPGGSSGLMTRGPGGSGVRFSLRGPSTPHGLGGSQLTDLRPSGGFNRFGSPRFGNNQNNPKDFTGRFGRDRERDRDWEHDRNRDRERDHDRDRGRDHDRDRARDQNREHVHDSQREHGRDRMRDAGGHKGEGKSASEDQPKNTERDGRRSGKTRWNTVEEVTAGDSTEKMDESKAESKNLVIEQTSITEPAPQVKETAQIVQKDTEPEQAKCAPPQTELAPAPMESEPSQGECIPPQVEHASADLKHEPPQKEGIPSPTGKAPSQVENTMGQIECAPPKVEHVPPQTEDTPPQVEHVTPQLEHPPPQLEHAAPQLEHPPPQLEHAPPQMEHAPPQMEHAPPQVNCTPTQPECTMSEANHDTGPEKVAQPQEECTMDGTPPSVLNDELSVKVNTTKTLPVDDTIMAPSVNKSQPGTEDDGEGTPTVGMESVEES